MDKNFFEKTHSFSIQLFLAILLLFILRDIFNFSIDNIFNLNLFSIIVAIVYAISTYKIIDNEKVQSYSKYLFFISGFLIILSNFFFLEELSKYHFFLYSILTSQILLFPFMFKETKSKNKLQLLEKHKTIIVILLLIVTILLSFLLRINSAGEIIPGRDSFHHYIAAKAINDHGEAVYTTLPYINEMLAFLFTVFGESLFIARLPFIIAGCLSILLIYFIGRKISENVGIIAAILFAICPWAIGLSRYVRDYSFNIFFELLFITLILYFPKKLKDKKSLIYFALLNLAIYLFITVFARFQRGLTISIIIAIFLATFVRVFAEYDLWSQLKKTKLNSKIVNYAISLFVILICVAGAIIVVFNFFNRLSFSFNEKWLFFFMSESQLPMLWYSFMQVPWFFIAILTILPLIILFRNRITWLSFGIFYSYLIFFVFLVVPHSSGLNARYIYTALPFFILLLAISLDLIIRSPPKFFKGNIMKFIALTFSIILLLGIFNIQNTIIGSEGKLSLIQDDERQVFSVGPREYDDLFTFLETNNFNSIEPVILSELRIKDVLGFFYDYEYSEGRSQKSFNGISYDIADNMYVTENESISVILENDNGWIIKRFGDTMPDNILVDIRSDTQRSDILIRNRVNIEYLGLYSDYEVYRWTRE